MCFIRHVWYIHKGSGFQRFISLFCFMVFEIPFALCPVTDFTNTLTDLLCDVLKLFILSCYALSILFRKTFRTFFIVILHLPCPDFLPYIFFIWRQCQLLISCTILSLCSTFTDSSDVSRFFFPLFYLVPLFESRQWIVCLLSASARIVNLSTYWVLLLSGSLIVTF